MEFAEAAELVRMVEEKALEYELPAAPAKAKKRLELSPAEYAEMSYAEALALYGRVEKVIAGAAMLQREIYGVAPEAPKPEAEVPIVVPARVPEKAAPPRAEAKPPALPAPPLEMEIERKEEKPAEVVEFEKPEAKPREIIEVGPPEAPRPPEAALPGIPGAAPEVSLRIPPVLMAPPAESAMETVEKLERQFGSEIKAGAKMDREKAKKRMLELTRELFREKSIDRREEIKKEIVTLKNILAEAEGKAKPKADIFIVVKNDQEYELSSAKKAVSEGYESAFAPLLKYFDEEAALGRGAEALPALEEKASMLRGQVAALAADYGKYLAEKHVAELDELERKGKGTKEMAEMRVRLASAYAAEFGALRDSIWSEIDAALGKRRAGAAPARAGAEEMSDEELLAYLQTEEELAYERYSRGEMTRVEALAEARKKLREKRK
ncbi:MAG: hypothetical protein AB1657_03470 [Candidatus Micrarchaeota archaeon]